MDAARERPALNDWLERVAWRRRAPELGELLEHETNLRERIAVIEIPGLTAENPTAELWLGLPHFPSILEPRMFSPAGPLLVRYAALDWSRTPVADVATLGIELTRIFTLVSVSVSAEQRGWLACPLRYVDLRGETRIGFAAPDGSAELANRLPPEVIDHWPACRERGLVFVVGQLLLGAIDLEHCSPWLKDIVRRCLARDPDARFGTLAELRDELVAAGGRRNRRAPAIRPETWDRIEHGIGLLMIDRPTHALTAFTAAFAMQPSCELARSGCAQAQRRGGVPTERRAPIVAPQQARTLDWSKVIPIVRALNADQDYTSALGYLGAALLTNPPAVYVETARTYQAAGELGPAVDFARRALVHEPANREMLAVAANGLFSLKRWRDALAAADAWLAVFSDDPAAHHVRGKCLFVLGQIAPARATFDRVIALDPKHLPAMWMIIEIERRISRVRATAGVDRSRAAVHPPHLAEIATLVAQERILEALEALRPLDDSAAIRMRAGCLAYLGNHADALVEYEKLDDTIGIARCLTQLGRADEALDILDEDDSAAALEIATDALDQLGRTADANDVLSARARRARTSRRRTRSPPSPSRGRRSRGPRCARCSGRTPCGSCRGRPSPGSSRP